MLRSLVIAATLCAVGALAQAEDGHIFNFDDVDWQPAGVEGAEFAILWGSVDDSTAIFAYRVQPGAVIPLHTHPNDYWGLSIQGRWIHFDADGNEEIHGQEAYAFVKGGDVHGDSCAGPEVCINIVDSDGPSETVFVE